MERSADNYTDRHTLGAGPTARLVASLAPALTPETRAQLRRMVTATVAAPSGTELVEARLGLLCDVVGDDPEGLPATGTYEVERERRHRDHGELWPAHSTLIELYHHWFTACEYARRRNEGPRKRVPLSIDHQDPEEKDEFTHEEAIASLLRFRAKYGTWPSWWEVWMWGRLTKRGSAARRRGEPRNPTTYVLTGLFGTVDDAVRRAEQRWNELRRV